jgi:hypothetical protein
MISKINITQFLRSAMNNPHYFTETNKKQKQNKNIQKNADQSGDNCMKPYLFLYL